MKLFNKIKGYLKHKYYLWDSPKEKVNIKISTINNYKMFVYTNDVIGRNIYYDKQYEIEETNFLKNEIRTNDICVDVGANIGYFSLLFASKAINGKVYSFEPIPFNYSLLQLNKKINSFTNIKIFQNAVSSKNGKSKFTISLDSAYSSLLDTKRIPAAEVVDVQTLTLTSFFKKEKLNKIDILKIDVEGAEELVLDGAKSVLSNKRTQPRILFIELFDLNLQPFKTDTKKIINKLNKFGYSPFYFNKSELIKLENYSVLPPEIYNFIFLK